MEIPLSAREMILAAQRNELTEHRIYSRLASSTKDDQNARVLQEIADDELRHYHFWKGYSQKDVTHNGLKAWWYVFLSKLFGITFGIKLMERGEENAQVTYEKISKLTPIDRGIIDDEEKHEQKLIGLLDEKRLAYVGSIVLGLNDALVELTGALAGFTLTLQDTRLISAVGLITGVAASLSMAASEYLSTKAEKSVRMPITSAVYTGVAYIFTVLFLIFPYLIFTSPFMALGLTVTNAILVILIFTYYYSVAHDASFRRRFTEMVSISLGVAAVTFCIGLVVKNVFHIEV
ncbi:MAG: hypothetical protein UY34_C0021G0006 [Parcubacteria group bacterium GW2011_GWA2_48_9]|nr:MAG: hypothetical protein UY34_C0021G0006 [Parcubacteria group bacterium GW2011_GWA2_48_9]